jgi:transcriptional regulator with XRE-family HTH domain
MENDILLTPNQRIKKLRKELKLTQEQLSKIIKVSGGLIAGIETDKCIVNDRIIKLISDSFKVNSEWLKTGKGDIFSEEQDPKDARLLALFNNLKPKYQDFIIDSIDRFLTLDDKTAAGTGLPGGE